MCSFVESIAMQIIVIKRQEQDKKSYSLCTFAHLHISVL